MKKKILFLCTGNSCRSQMAEGLLRHYGNDRYDVVSAGTKPSFVHPVAVQIMKEIGIDISKHTSKSAMEFIGQQFDYVITVCDNAKESCPTFPGRYQRIHWSFEDPAACDGDNEQKLDFFRKIRNQIKERVVDFLK